MYKVAITDYYSFAEGTQNTCTTTKDLGEDLDKAMRELKDTIMAFEAMKNVSHTTTRLEYKVVCE